MIVEPARSRRTQYGATADDPVAPVVLTDAAPAILRRWNASPLLNDTSMNPCAAPGCSDSRIITPAFTQGSVFDTASTRATIEPSPDNG